MNKEEWPQAGRTGDPRISIAVRTRRLGARSIIFGTVRRMIRFPMATLTGAVLAIASHAAVLSWLDPGTNIMGTIFVEILLGIAEFLLLSSFMVLDQNRLAHLDRLFRSGLVLSLIAAGIAFVPIALVAATIPTEWIASPLFQELAALWPISAHGFGIGGLLVVLPAFPLAWSICANTGVSLYQSVGFVWSAADGNAYSGPVLAATLALTAWLLVTVPGLGLLVPITYAHASAYLFASVIEVRVRASS